MENNKNNPRWYINLLKKLSILILSSLFILIVLEIAVRLFTKPLYPILQTDAQVGTIHQKNFRGLLYNYEARKENYIITNNLGYIGPDVSKEKEENTLRIAVIGDSMTEGLQVDFYKNFVFLLENGLNIAKAETGKKFEVLNYGVGGTGTFLHYQTYKKNIAPFKPDIFLLIFSESDYLDNLAKMNFDLENYKNEKSRNTILKSFLLKFQLPKYLFSKLQNNLFFLETLNKLGLYELNDDLKANMKGKNLEEKKEFYDYTFSIIKKLKKSVEDNGTEFVLIIMPAENSYKTRDAWKSNNRITKLMEFAQREKIRYFNPSEILALSKQQYSQCLTYGCVGHFNELGHEVFARALYEFLTK